MRSFSPALLVVTALAVACGSFPAPGSTVDNTTPADSGGVQTGKPDAGSVDASIKPPPNAPDSGSTGEPAGPPTPGLIACGTGTCDPGTQFCCAQLPTSQGTGVTFVCLATGTTCGGPALACDEPGDCTSGDVCCASTRAGPGGGGGAAGSKCVAATACTGRGSIQLCHQDSDCPASDPTCCAEQLTAGGACRPSCNMGRPDGGFPRPDGGPPRRDGGFPPPPPPGLPDGG